LTLLTNASGALLKPAEASPLVTVIGIIGDTKNDGLRNQARPMAITPFTLVAPPNRGLAVRSRGSSDALVNAIRTQLREIDKQQPLDRAMSAVKALETETVQPRFTMALFGVFAAIGLALAAAGIYSVLSFLVTRRKHEIGVRMALGAQWGDILRLVLSTGAKLIASGLVVGLLGGFAVTRLLNAHLFGVTSGDPISYGAVVAVLAAVGFLACYIPARRAARVNPTEALRCE
jgi:ABC-type antimicrobial peptide transport system permease subunit